MAIAMALALVAQLLVVPHRNVTADDTADVVPAAIAAGIDRTGDESALTPGAEPLLQKSLPLRRGSSGSRSAWRQQVMRGAWYALVPMDRAPLPPLIQSISSEARSGRELPRGLDAAAVLRPLLC